MMAVEVAVTAVISVSFVGYGGGLYTEQGEDGDDKKLIYICL